MIALTQVKTRKHLEGLIFPVLVFNFPFHDVILIKMFLILQYSMTCSSALLHYVESIYNLAIPDIFLIHICAYCMWH